MMRSKACTPLFFLLVRGRRRYHRTTSHRCLATVYAVGEGWTGALGTGRLEQDIPGHYDDDEYEEVSTHHDDDVSDNDGDTQRTNTNHRRTPIPILYEGPVQAVAVGWGHTAMIVPCNHHRNQYHSQQQILMAGRPHDFSALLRLKRLPKWLRDYSVRQTLDSTLEHPAIEPETIAATSNDSVPFNTSKQQQQQQMQEPHTYNLLNPTDMIGGFVTWLSNVFSPKNAKDWEMARKQSILPQLTPLELELKDVGEDEVDYPVQIACSAGFTAYITQKGHLYAFGLNGYGQCGIGLTTNNVWQPTRVTGLNAGFATVPRAQMPQEFPVVQTALGLQHGICLNAAGEVFCWGKGERGQLGQEMTMMESHTALPLKRAFTADMASLKNADYENGQQNHGATSTLFQPKFQPVGKVVQIDAGMIHSAALTEDNRVLIWGKHVLPAFGDDVGKKPASDAVLPFMLSGLPAGIKVEQIACGSHHTSMLLEDGSVWAVGVSSDSNEPMHEPTMLIPSGVVEMPVRQFAAHMDRTTVVGYSGRQVLQVHLWKDPELREYAVFTPSWLEELLQEKQDIRIREVHRGWVHSVVVTD